MQNYVFYSFQTVFLNEIKRRTLIYNTFTIPMVLLFFFFSKILTFTKEYIFLDVVFAFLSLFRMKK